MPKRVHVAVAVIRNQHNQILISQRLQHTHMGGLWEFPGGKVEADESVRDALKREIQEELGLVIRDAEPLICVPHDYPDKHVLLDVWQVTSCSGNAEGREGQLITWAAPQELHQYEFPVANRPIVTAVQLPRYYPIIDDSVFDRDLIIPQLKRLLNIGHSLVQLRLKQQSKFEFDHLTSSAVELCRQAGVHLLINSDIETAQRLGASGVHLNRNQLTALSLLDVPESFWVAASCHNEQELAQAEALGVDFVVLSPVMPTLSHPDRPHIGWPRFEEMIGAAKLPVFALGGLASQDLPTAIQSGGQGVSGIRLFAKT